MEIEILVGYILALITEKSPIVIPRSVAYFQSGVIPHHFD